MVPTGPVPPPKLREAESDYPQNAKKGNRMPRNN